MSDQSTSQERHQVEAQQRDLKMLDVHLDQRYAPNWRVSDKLRELQRCKRPREDVSRRSALRSTKLVSGQQRESAVAVMADAKRSRRLRGGDCAPDDCSTILTPGIGTERLLDPVTAYGLRLKEDGTRSQRDRQQPVVARIRPNVEHERPWSCGRGSKRPVHDAGHHAFGALHLPTQRRIQLALELNLKRARPSWTSTKSAELAMRPAI